MDAPPSREPGRAPADWPGWPAEDVQRYRAAGYWRDELLGDIPARQAAERPHAPALVDGERRWTYAELDRDIRALSGGLHRLGFRPGDRVIVQLPNQAEFVLLWFALHRLGAVPVHAMPGHRRAEIGHLARLTEAAGYVVPDRHARFDHRELAAEIRENHRTLQRVIVVGDPGGHPDFLPFDTLYGDGTGPAAPPSPAPPATWRSCCCPAAPPEPRNSSRAPTTTTRTTRAPRPGSAGWGRTPSTSPSCRSPSTSPWPAPASSAP